MVDIAERGQNKKQYFATQEGQRVVEHLDGYRKTWQSLVGQAGDSSLGAVWLRNIFSYYSTILEGNSDTGLGFTGDLGEIVSMKVPQARSLNTQLLSLTTKQKLNFEPIAESLDALSINSNVMASAIADKIVREQRLDEKGLDTAEKGSLVGSSYIMSLWDMSKGRMIATDPETGANIYTGDLTQTVHGIYDMSFNFMQPQFTDQDWVECCVPRNRWDLIAMYPELEDEILAVPSVRKANASYRFMWETQANDDMILVWYWFHRSTPALPGGRHMVYASEKAIFFDEENPYKIDEESGQAYIPISEFKPEKIQNTGFGYPVYSNLLPLQEMYDNNFSTQASNNAAMGIRSILNPTGNGINVKHIAGLNFVNFTPLPNVAGGGKPEVLDLNAPNTESYRFNDQILANMQQIYNLNAAIRGNPPPGVTSGTAIATLSTNAIEFNASFTKAYYGCLEMAVTHGLWAYRLFGDEEMLVSCAGPNDASVARQFKRASLSTIRRLHIPVANPLMATSAGRFEIANNLLQTGLVKTPNKYFRILEGAPTRDLYEKEFDQQQFISEENDELRKPEEEGPMEVHALAMDDHPQHIQAHSTLLNNVEVRNDPVRRQKIEQHILDHFRLAQTTDPLLYQMLTTGQMPQMPPPPPAPSAGGMEGMEEGAMDPTMALEGAAEPAEMTSPLQQSGAATFTGPTLGG